MCRDATAASGSVGGSWAGRGGRGPARARRAGPAPCSNAQRRTGESAQPTCAKANERVCVGPMSGRRGLRDTARARGDDAADERLGRPGAARLGRRPRSLRRRCRRARGGAGRGLGGDASGEPEPGVGSVKRAGTGGWRGRRRDRRRAGRPNGSGPIRRSAVRRPRRRRRPRIRRRPAHPSPRRNPGETKLSVRCRMNVELVRWPGVPSGSPTFAIRACPGCSWWRTTPSRRCPPTVSKTGWPPSAPETYLEARAAALQARAPVPTASRPDPTATASSHHRDVWVSLSPVEQVARPGAARSRSARLSPCDALAEPCVARGRAPTRNALDVHVLRLGARLAPLGLEIRTVRSRGPPAPRNRVSSRAHGNDGHAELSPRSLVAHGRAGCRRRAALGRAGDSVESTS